MTSNDANGPSTPAVALALARAASTSFRRRYETISPADLAVMTGSAEPPTIIDVRLPDDFLGGHIDGAINLPYHEPARHRYEVPRGRPVVVVCYLGMLSRTVAQRLVADGHGAVFNLDRGMKGWRDVMPTGPRSV